MDRYLMQTVQVFFSPFHPTVAGLCRHVKAAGCCWSPLLSTADIPGGVVLSTLRPCSGCARTDTGTGTAGSCAIVVTGTTTTLQHRKRGVSGHRSTARWKKSSKTAPKKQQRLDVSAFKFYRFLLEIWLADRTTAAKAIMSRNTCD